MVQVIHHTTKTLTIKKNWRSADFVTPNFLYWCMGGCRDAYCYVMRYNYDKVYVAENREQILQKVNDHATTLLRPKPSNQTDPRYRTYDIWCSSDICLHWWLIEWKKIFEFFINHPIAKATFATKYVNKKLLDIHPQKKVRIRFSLMPQSISSILEPTTSKIADRIDAITQFQQAWYEVHLNFSPIVLYKGRREDYQKLFEDIAKISKGFDTSTVQCEAIFMTHNQWQHERNLLHWKIESEELLWQPDYQEKKVSGFGSQAVRYKRWLKSRYIHERRKLHDSIIPRNTIRYIF